MTDYSDLIQPDKGQDARPIHLVDKKGYDEWLKGRSARERAHLAAVGFKPDAFVHAILPGDDPEKWAEAESYSIQSLEMRKQLWDGVFEEMKKHQPA